MKVRAEVYSRIVDFANEDSALLFSVYCGDDYFTHYDPTDGDPSYDGLKDPWPTVAETIPSQ